MVDLELRSLTKQFPNGVRALDSVSLSFQPGEVVAILGPSGAGKSTLLRCVNGLERPSSGEVWVGGVRVQPSNYRAIRKDVGMIFQQFNLVPRLSVLANVLCGALARSSWITNLLFVFPQTEIDAAYGAIKRVGLSGREFDRAQKLSGGQQQRVAIARTLVHRPKILLADEPVASLDPATSVEVLELMVQLAREANICLILNLHQVELAQQFCDRIVGLKQGKLLFDVKPSELNPSILDDLYLKGAVA